MIFRTIVFVAVIASATHAYGQNVNSQKLIAMSVPERNAAFTRLMKANNEACNQTTKTVFNGSSGQIDDWEMLCADGNSYSLSVPSDSTTIIKYLSCKELLALNRLIDVRSGKNSKSVGCRIN
jgi:hypothetical protein